MNEYVECKYSAHMMEGRKEGGGGREHVRERPLETEHLRGLGALYIKVTLGGAACVSIPGVARPSIVSVLPQTNF